MAVVLIIDDDFLKTKNISDIITGELFLNRPDIEIVFAQTEEEAWQQYQANKDELKLIVCDYALPQDQEGFPADMPGFVMRVLADGFQGKLFANSASRNGRLISAGCHERLSINPEENMKLISQALGIPCT